jgi:hypothetical protein
MAEHFIITTVGKGRNVNVRLRLSKPVPKGRAGAWKPGFLDTFSFKKSGFDKALQLANARYNTLAIGLLARGEHLKTAIVTHVRVSKSRGAISIGKRGRRDSNIGGQHVLVNLHSKFDSQSSAGGIASKVAIHHAGLVRFVREGADLSKILQLPKMAKRR